MRSAMRAAVAVVTGTAMLGGLGAGVWSITSAGDVRAAGTGDQSGDRAGDQSPDRASDLRRADVMLVKIHADWCPKCAAQAKNWAAVEPEFLGQQDVLFVKLDITDKQRRAHSELLANELGLGDIWEARSKRTGQMFLVDRETKQIVADFAYTAPSSDVSEAIAAALD
ncbi:MAG: thioredoxin family protein [Planctomycetota bacterium]